MYKHNNYIKVNRFEIPRILGNFPQIGNADMTETKSTACSENWKERVK